MPIEDELYSQANSLKQRIVGLMNFLAETRSPTPKTSGGIVLPAAAISARKKEILDSLAAIDEEYKVLKEKLRGWG